MTNEHVINKDMVKNQESFMLYFDNEKKIEDLIKENNNNDPDTANLKLFKTMAENE